MRGAELLRKVIFPFPGLLDWPSAVLFDPGFQRALLISLARLLAHAGVQFCVWSVLAGLALTAGE